MRGFFSSRGAFLFCAFFLFFQIVPITSQCSDSLSAPCPASLIGNWRLFEIQRTGEPILDNPIKLFDTGTEFIFNATAGDVLTIAAVKGCNITSPYLVFADSTLVGLNTTIRTILRIEGINTARMVTNSPGICAWPDSFDIPIPNAFWKMYVWGRVCLGDPPFEASCPQLIGEWDGVSSTGTKVRYIYTNETRTTIDPTTGATILEENVYCTQFADASIYMRTLLISPVDQFGAEQRIFIIPSPTSGFTQVVNPTGNCTWPNSTTSGFDVYTVKATLPPVSSNNLPVIPIAVGTVVGGVVLISAIVVVSVFLVLRRTRLLANERAALGTATMSPHDNYGSDKGYKIPIELLPYRNPDGSHSSVIVNGDRSWEIDFNELMLEDEIGSGSFGVVWRGQWRNTEVAVKQMRGQMSEKQLSAFLQEAGLLGKLRPHNNVMLFLGVCTQPYPCIVTELLSGGSLFDLLVKGDLSLDKKLKLAMDICSGMAHLHSESVIHRDLATRNVLLNETGIAKIADFGMSRVLEGNSSNGGAQTLSAIGPVKWMSPEALNERKYSVYSDVWSFGVLLWEMWARKEPFANLDATQAAIKIARDSLTLPRPDRCPEAVWIVMGNCWAVIKEDRPTFSTLFKQFSNLSRENATSPSRYVQY